MNKRLPLRILLVEDVSLNQLVALRHLERLGYRADIASNGLEALAALCCHSYDVVFMDVQMPKMDGLEATRRITRQWSPLSRPWIVAMTAHTISGDREECLSAGMNDYISKPIRTEALVQALERYRHVREEELGRWGAGVIGRWSDREKTTQRLSGCTTTPPPYPPTSLSPIDTQVLQALRNVAGEDADEILAEVIESYLEDAPSRLQVISKAVAQADVTTLQRTAHSLKSISVTVGATSVSQLCETLEAMGRVGTTFGAETLVEQLQSEYRRLEVALQVEHPGSKN